MDNSYNYYKESELVHQAGGQLKQKTYKTCKV